MVGVQPGLAQYLKGPGLRWRISYKTVDGDGRPISIYTLTKPLETACELMSAPQQPKVDHERKQSSAGQQQARHALETATATAARIETNAAARALGFKVPQARASQSHRMRVQTKQKSALSAAQSRSREQRKAKGNLLQNEATPTSSEDDDSSDGSSDESEDSPDSESEDEK